MTRITFNIVVVALALASYASHAQTARSGGGAAANAQLMQQIQQLGSERTRLQAENAKLKKDLEDLRKDRDALKSTQQAGAARVKSSEIALQSSLAQGATTDKELAQNNEKLQQLQGKYQELLQSLQITETERTTTKQTLTSREQDLKVCIDRNQTLYEASQKALARLEHGTVSTRVTPSQLEALIDDYKDRPAPLPATAPASQH